jgi:hypothetical protein
LEGVWGSGRIPSGKSAKGRYQIFEAESDAAKAANS